MATILCGSVQFHNVQAVLFDKDGTLADSHNYLRSLGQKRARLIDAQIPGVQEPLLLAFGIEGSQLNPAGLLAVGSRQENEIAAAAYIAETGRNWLEALEIARSTFAEADHAFTRKADNTPLFSGTLELLQALAAAGVKVGIVSSDSTRNVQDFVERYHLGDLVQCTIGAGSGPNKPEPQVFHLACELLGVSPQATLLIGDSDIDLTMARAAKAKGFVGIAWIAAQAAVLKEADVLITSFSDISVSVNPPV